MKPHHLAVAAALAATVLGAAATNAAPARAATFVWANNGDIGSMDPYTRQETVQLSFMDNVYESLVRHDPALNIEASLATSWKQVSPTVWRFNLRHGVKFSDGTPLTADDVVFSAKRIEAPTSAMRTALASVKAVRKIDPYTVEIETKQPDPILLQELTQFYVMSQKWSVAHNAVAPAQFDAKGKENYATMHLLGSGPYKLVLREPDRRTIVDRNPQWWGKMSGNADRVELDVIGNDATRVAGLLSGQLDMIYTVPPQDEARIMHTPGLKLWKTPELRTIYLGLDTHSNALMNSDVKGKNPLKDVRVRRAFALAIDENLIASKIMRGEAHPTWEMWGPGISGYNAALDHRPAANPAEAKKLLAEAGYPHGFSITLDCPNDRYVNDAAICTAVVSMLARVGVKVHLIAQTKAKFFGKILPPKYDTNFYLLGWTPATYDALNPLFALLGTANGTTGEVNAGRYSNPKIDALIPQIAVQTDQAKRQALINKAITILQTDVATIPLHQQVIVWASKKTVSFKQMADDDFPYRYITVNKK